MKCLKNPRRNPKLMNSVEQYSEACNINVMLIANFLDALRALYPKRFGKTGCENYLSHFKDSVKWLEADGDSEIRDYRMNSLLKDMPYVTVDLATNILKTLCELAAAEDRRVLCRPEYVGGLLENIVLLLATLHEDYGFGEMRIGVVISRWLEGQIRDGDKWLAENFDYISDPAADRRYMEDALLERKNRKNRVTVREQLDARRELEALKAYQQEVSKQ